MLHSVLMSFKTEFEHIKISIRVEDFNTLRSLLMKRLHAIEKENRDALQGSYNELFKEIKKLTLTAEKQHQLYLKNRAALIKKLDIEWKTVVSEPLLIEYADNLKALRDEILNVDAEIDMKFLKKLEETLQQEKAGFSQQSLFTFFQSNVLEVEEEKKVSHQSGVK